MTKLDFKRCSESAIARTLQCAIKYSETRACDDDATEVIHALMAAATELKKQAAPPLRTRAEVDAELSKAVREHLRLLDDKVNWSVKASDASWARIRALCAEPLAPEPEKKETHSIHCGVCNVYDGHREGCPEAVDAPDPDPVVLVPESPRDDAAFRRGIDAAHDPEPERCSCEEAEALRAKLESIRRIVLDVGALSTLQERKDAAFVALFRIMGVLAP